VQRPTTTLDDATGWGGGEMICVCVEGRGVRVNRRRLGVGTCSKKLWNA
jgi:hypothetical protein